MTKPTVSPEAVLFAELSRLLDTLKLGSCSCMTKSPEVSAHAPTCRYRLVSKAQTKLEQLEEKVLRATLAHASPAPTTNLMQCRKCGADRSKESCKGPALACPFVGSTGVERPNPGNQAGG